MDEKPLNVEMPEKVSSNHLSLCFHGGALAWEVHVEELLHNAVLLNILPWSFVNSNKHLSSSCFCTLIICSHLDHVMELNVLPEEIHKSLIATHETVEQFVFKLFILLLFVLLHNQHV